ncbi:NusG domain II-containing protein [Desulfoscipio sp. XC116]|uniref:NusG domain II-containing protein n=1 Tax=Desulfoscipio sp. XC116 TaxID=3144975 RepID=UPI00325C109A
MNNINKFIYIILASLIIASFIGAAIYKQSLKNQKPVAVIYKNEQVYQRINLTESINKQIKIEDSEGHYNIVEIKDGRVRIKEADCPNKLCVKAGWLTKPGQMAVCMPNRLRVVIEGVKEDVKQPDTISF